MAYILRERPQITIWFHQHMNLIDDTRGSEPIIIKAYSLYAHMRAQRLAPLPGTATRWQNHRLARSSSFVVELPAGPMTPLAVRRHIRAIVAATEVVDVP